MLYIMIKTIKIKQSTQYHSASKPQFTQNQYSVYDTKGYFMLVSKETSFGLAG